MRLLRVHVERFWGGRPLVLDLERRRFVKDQPALAFLVGPNGSGKSRALAVIGQIFRALASSASPMLDFRLEYELGDARVFVGSSLPAGVSAASRVAQIDCYLLIAEPWTGAWRAEHALERLPTDADLWLPPRIVGVASGPTSRLGEALNPRYDEQTSDAADGAGNAEQATPTAIELDQPRCLALSAPELRLAVLSLMSHPRARDRVRASHTNLTRRVGLSSGEDAVMGFALELHGSWRSMVPDQAMAVEHLLKQATRRTSTVEVAGEDVREHELAVFEVRDADLAWIMEIGEEPVTWFDRLLSWHRRGAVLRSEVLLSKADGPGIVAVDELSDGEFLMLGRYALLLLLAGHGGALMLMDEPETHFNDQWKVDLVADVVRTLGGPAAADDVFVATHSDLTLTDADHHNVFVLADGQVTAPQYSTFAADRDQVTLAVNQAAQGIGHYSEDEVQRAIGSRDAGALEAMLRRTGPGFQQFRLHMALERLRRAG